VSGTLITSDFSLQYSYICCMLQCFEVIYSGFIIEWNLYYVRENERRIAKSLSLWKRFTPFSCKIIGMAEPVVALIDLREGIKKYLSISLVFDRENSLDIKRSLINNQTIIIVSQEKEIE